MILAVQPRCVQRALSDAAGKYLPGAFLTATYQLSFTARCPAHVLL